MGLAEKACVPCRGGVSPLGEDEAQRYLAEIQGWALAEGAPRIERRFRFKDFAAAMDFARKVGEIAERDGHHPDISFGWGYCAISFHTHKIHGLHENDFIMAAKVNALAG
ncbi:MAG TPA: 4a-hydroxytetrahydrobiopterin dehydratase [Candidatus Limnocylindrales bacterium]|nr:4a-hydroxytetrahydrobiopterin dehydratase [Candidatus Limnocylindrales bacterium]